MLMLTRKRYGDREVELEWGGVKVVVTVYDWNYHTVTLGFTAPPEVHILRPDALVRVPKEQLPMNGIAISDKESA